MHKSDMMLMMDEYQQVTKHHKTFIDRVGAMPYSNHFKTCLDLSSKEQD
jgi:hypothetical protein